MKNPGHRYTITVCKDGFVSIIDTEDTQTKPQKQRRIGAALPIFSVPDVLDAFELIRRLCTLVRCHHGGKTGTLIEPKITSWTRREADLDDIAEAAREFEAEYEKLPRSFATDVAPRNKDPRELHGDTCMEIVDENGKSDVDGAECDKPATHYCEPHQTVMCAEHAYCPDAKPITPHRSRTAGAAGVRGRAAPERNRP